MFGIGHGPEIIVLLIIVLLVFGPGKLPEIGSAFGRGIREFKDATNGLHDQINTPPQIQQPQPPRTIQQPQPDQQQYAPPQQQYAPLQQQYAPPQQQYAPPQQQYAPPEAPGPVATDHPRD